MFNTTRMYYGWTQVSKDLTECSGRSRGGAWRARPPLIFRKKNWGRKGRKNVLETAPPTPPSPLSQGLDPAMQCKVIQFLFTIWLNTVCTISLEMWEFLCQKTSFWGMCFKYYFFCSFLILIVLFLLSSLLFSHKAISSRWLINTRKKLNVGPEDCRILLML